MKKLILLFLAAFVFGFALPSSASTITVKDGDSLWEIAKRYKVSFQKVVNLNDHFSNKHLIYPGDKVYIPSGTTTETAENSESDNISSSNKTAPAQGVSTMAEAVLLLVNQERKKQGLNDLELSENLTSLADLKAQDMAEKNYFSHTSPTYGTPFEMLQSHGISYKTAGENIAAGQLTAQEVMESWMSSSGHRANILNKSYTKLGVGYYAGGSYKTYWSQLFIGN